MEWFFLIAVLLVFVGLIFWLRERRAAQRDAERAREEAFLLQMASARGAASQPRAAPAPGTAIQPDADPPPADHLEAVPERRPYLDRRYRVVYFWLKAGLPNHEIIPRGSLRRVVGREQVGKDMLLDFLICDPALSVVAVVDLERGAADAAATRFKKELLEGAGVRYACWPADALPDKSTLPVWLA